jgi:hypothetical protein
MTRGTFDKRDGCRGYHGEMEAQLKTCRVNVHLIPSEIASLVPPKSLSGGHSHSHNARRCKEP